MHRAMLKPPQRGSEHGSTLNEMDTEWFDARAELLGVTQDDIGRKLGLDRTTVGRIKNGRRPLTLAEVEAFASILQVPPLEIIARAYKWRTPIRAETELRADLLEIALECANEALGDNHSTAEVARQAAGIYELLMQSEARGRPIASNKDAIRLIAETIRTTLRATRQDPPKA